MTTITYSRATPTANDLFKAQYNRTLRWSLLLALLIVMLFFLFSPKYVPHPYKLRQKEVEVVDVQEAVDIPPPPQEIPKPRVNVEAAPDEDVDEEVDIADNLMDADDLTSMDTTWDDTGGETFQVSQEKPKLIKFAVPDYPEMARASQLEGTVVVKVLVGSDGSVLQAIVIQPVHPLLDREAIKAAKRCKFLPGKQRGIPVKAWMALPFSFRLH